MRGIGEEGEAACPEAADDFGEQDDERDADGCDKSFFYASIGMWLHFIPQLSPVQAQCAASLR